jgi:hypothetical protein
VKTKSDYEGENQPHILYTGALNSFFKEKKLFEDELNKKLEAE